MAQIFQRNIIIRERGQLTIPKKIREKLGWTKENFIITISIPDEKSLLITSPQYNSPSETVDWDNLWKKLEKVRSFNGKQKGSLSDFIIKDRERH